MKNNTPLFKRIRENRIFWPLVALALILIADAIFAPGFFKIILHCNTKSTRIMA